MAYNDWNGDGKHDSSDDYIGYQIYKDCNKKGGGNGGGGCGFIVLCAALLIGAVAFIGWFCDIFDTNFSEMSDFGAMLLYGFAILVVGVVIAVIKELFHR